jgi:hypothetical protein
MSNEHKILKPAHAALKLTDTQLVLLSAAAQRDDHCLTAAPNLKGGAAQKVVQKLIAAGLVREIRAKSGTPVWRRDEETAQSFALKLTAAGLKAIAVDHEAVEDEAADPTLRTAATAPRRDPGEGGRTRLKGREASAGDIDQPREDAAPSVPRPGSKTAAIIDLLQRDQGSTIEELIAATGWLPHTTRAALTGLKKRGCEIARSRTDGVSRYTIERRDYVLNDPHDSQDRGASAALRDEQAA